MKSMDIFDTLIGRWYYYPDSIFDEIASVAEFDNFKYWRKHAESVTSDKTFDGIYRKFKELTGSDDETVLALKELEFKLEQERTFRIVENVDKVDLDTILISDTYFDKNRLTKLLSKNGIDRYSAIVCSYDGKATGKVWNEIRPDTHLGDNLRSDYEIARSAGIDARHFDSGLSENEKWLETHGFQRLAYLCRAVRLSNPYNRAQEGFSVWNEQADVNLPILVLLSNHIAKEYQDCRLLFTFRDCCNLYPLFNLLYPGKNTEKFFSSRKLYYNPTDSFREYTSEIYTDEAVIIDLQGTGDSCFSYFKRPRYFTLVNSDLNDKNKIAYLVHRRDGYSDRIERLNYYEYSYEDVIKIGDRWTMLHPKPTNSFDIIQKQRLAFEKALVFIKDGFSVETDFNEKLLIDFMNYLERNHCHICSYVNHEEM